VIVYDPASTPARPPPSLEVEEASQSTSDPSGAAYMAQAAWRASIANRSAVDFSPLAVSAITPFNDLTSRYAATASVDGRIWDVTCASGFAEVTSLGVTAEVPVLVAVDTWVNCIGLLLERTTTDAVDVQITRPDLSTFTETITAGVGTLIFLGLANFTDKYQSFLITPASGEISVKQVETGWAF
jgi:hypothetical protein